MFLRSLRIFMIVMLALAGSIYSFAQAADNRSSLIVKPGEDDDNADRPKSFKETMVKLRIEKEKKEYDEMIERGEKALKLSEELERAYAHNGRLTQNEFVKLDTVEKLVKKIRNDLGGDDEEEEMESSNFEEPRATERRLSPADAVKSFRDTTVRLMGELKKTTRFTISAAAIQTTNAVLKLTHFLRITK